MMRLPDGAVPATGCAGGAGRDSARATLTLRGLASPNPGGLRRGARPEHWPRCSKGLRRPRRETRSEMAFDKVVLGALVVTSLLWPSDFDRHRGRYDAVIARAEALATTPGSVARFRATGPSIRRPSPPIRMSASCGRGGRAGRRDHRRRLAPWRPIGYLYAKPEPSASDLPGCSTASAAGMADSAAIEPAGGLWTANWTDDLPP